MTDDLPAELTANQPAHRPRRDRRKVTAALAAAFVATALLGGGGALWLANLLGNDEPAAVVETANVGDHYLRAAERLAATHRSTTDDEALDLMRANTDAFGAVLDGELTPADLRDAADLSAFNAYWMGEAGCVAARDAALRLAAGALAAADAMAAGNDALAVELLTQFDREALDALPVMAACQP